MSAENNQLSLKLGGNLTSFSLFFFFCSISILLFYLLYPMLNSIILAMILSGLFYPFCQFLHRRFKMKLSVAGLLSCTIITLSTLLPFLYFASRLTIEAYTVFEKQSEFFTVEAVSSLFLEDGFIFVKLNELLAFVGYQINTEDITGILIENANQITQFILDLTQKWIRNTFNYTFSIAFDFVIMILIMYGFFTQGKSLKRFCFYVIPLHPYRTKTVLKKFNQMNYVTLVVNGIGGVIQGVASGLTFFIAGIESVFLWTFLMIILAFIPLLGMSIIYIPAALYLVVQEQYISAILVVLVSAATSLIVENWYKPRFIGKQVQVNSTFLLIGMIGGLIQFGALGIFYGPIIITVFLSFYEFIKTEFIRAEPRHPRANNEL